MRWTALSAALVIAASWAGPSRVEAQVNPPRWSHVHAPQRADARFSVRVGGQVVPLRVMALPVLPGAQVDIAKEGSAGGRLAALAEGGGRLRQNGADRWIWTAPEQLGFHAVQIVSSQPVDTIHITFMVSRPATDVRNLKLGGYSIGVYKPRPPSMPATYEPPTSFVEARPQDYDILVSPNFRLGQFLCKQPGDPQYLVVSPRLLVKLEALLVAVNEAGYETAALTVMSGFRTPAYNRAIGNTTDFSRHLWGDAADVYVDNDGDGEMDDLNRDGRRDLQDARWLADVVERLVASNRSLPVGGLAVYRRNAVHGPFVHVDARGQRARW